MLHAHTALPRAQPSSSDAPKGDVELGAGFETGAFETLEKDFQEVRARSADPPRRLAPKRRDRVARLAPGRPRATARVTASNRSRARASAAGHATAPPPEP